MKVFFFILIAFPQFSEAEELPCPNGVIDLAKQISVLEDPGRLLTIKQIIEPGTSRLFHENTDGIRNFGLTHSAMWFRITAQMQAGCGKNWLLVLWPLLDTVEFYQQDQGVWQHLITGDIHPYASRDVDHNFLVFQIPDMSAGLPPYYLRVTSDSSMLMGFWIWHKEAFKNRSTIEMLFYGIFIGMLCALIIYNLFLFLFVRDVAYLFYVVYLMSSLMFALVLTGMTARYLWPESPYWNNLSEWFFLLTAMSGFTTYIRSMLALESIAPRLDRVIKHFVFWLLICTIGLFFLNLTIMVKVVMVLCLIGYALLSAAVLTSLRSGNRLVYYVTAAFLMQLMGAVWTIYAYTGFVTDGEEWHVYILQVCILIEAFLMSLILTERIRQLRLQEQSARQALLVARIDFSRQLIAAQNNERRRIASDLHDGIGQNLIVIKNRLNRFNQLDKQSPVFGKLNFIAEITQQTINDIRRIAHRLHPHQLDRLGLSEAIVALLDDTLLDTGITITSHIENIDKWVNQDQALHIYRIVQEALKNIISHADADEVLIRLTANGNGVNLHISDNGSGIHATWFGNKDFSQSFGLSNIHERVQIMGGTIEMKNQLPQGLSINICIPSSSISGQASLV